jgi:hypothetical protein
MRAAVGQIWASTDSRDAKHGWRQERIVTSISEHKGIRYAFLQTRRHGQPVGNGSHGVKLAPDGSIPRHRYVAAGLDPKRQQDAAQRADNLEVEADELYRQALAKRAQAEQLRESWMLPA